MRPCDSVAGTRCTRCVPPSNLKTLYAPSPLISNVYLPSPTSSASGLKPRRSAYLVSMRKTSPAHRPASSPPAPPWISMMTFLSSLGSRSTIARRISSSSSSTRRARACQLVAQLGVLGLGQQLLRALDVALRAAPLLGELRGGLELAVRATGRGVALPVADHVGSLICRSASA